MTITTEVSLNRRIREVKLQAHQEIKNLKAQYNSLYQKSKKDYSIGEEIFNSVTHGIGALLSIAGLVVLVMRCRSLATQSLLGYYYVGTIVFASSMIILYTMSTLYHALTPYKAKKIFAIFDHTSIYLLIAGTYTPFCLITLHGALGWTLFGIIWGLAIIGITLYSIFGKRIRKISAVSYVLMGWMIMFVAKPMYYSLPSESFRFLTLGGIAYTIGVVFYALKKIKWMHCIWHLFVLLGSIFHFFCVFYSI